MTTTDPRHHPAPHRVRLTDVRRQGWWQLHPGVRSDTELNVGERAPDAVRDALGSSPLPTPAVVLAGVGIGTALARDGRARPAAARGLLGGAPTVVELSVVLVSLERADRAAGALALHDLESIRWSAAKIHEVGDEVGQLREAVAQLVARPDTQRTVHRETTR